MLALRLEGVTKHFGGLCAVDGVALEVQPGERRALIGPNGAGKTTLFNLIAGALPVSSGRITLFGRDVTGASAHRRAAQGLARTVLLANPFTHLLRLYRSPIEPLAPEAFLTSLAVVLGTSLAAAAAGQAAHHRLWWRARDVL